MSGTLNNLDTVKSKLSDITAKVDAENDSVKAIRQSILDKGVSVTSETPLAELPNKIKEICIMKTTESSPVGEIIAFMGRTAPEHYLTCDGTEYPIGAYPLLEKFFVGQFGSVNFFGGDGTTTFSVPDLRGEFLRGTGTNSHANQGSGMDSGIHQDASTIPYLFVHTDSSIYVKRMDSSSANHPSGDAYVKSNVSGAGSLRIAPDDTYNDNVQQSIQYTTRPTNTSVLYCIKYEQTYSMQEYPNAGFHNSMYRGKYLGDCVTEEQYAAIAAGTFEGLYIGDYWTIDNVNWRIATFDYYLNCGDTPCTKHHAVIVPDTVLYNYVMNDTGTTTGGYVGSKLYKEGLEQAKTMIKTAFSGHVLQHRVFLTDAVSDGVVFAGTWYDSEVELMNEQMVYGGAIFKPTGNGSIVYANHLVEKTQLSLFVHEPSRIGNRAWYWLRDVISDSIFAGVSTNGNASTDDASISRGIRPFFCIY